MMIKFLTIFRMIAVMLSIVLKKHKVFDPIVVSNAIQMVNNLRFIEKSIDMPFHYNAMFSDVSAMIPTRMIRNKNHDITRNGFVPSTSPIGTFFTRELRKFSSFIPCGFSFRKLSAFRGFSGLGNPITPLRAIFPMSHFYFIWANLKYFTTCPTFGYFHG